MTGDAVSQADIARLFDVYLQKPFSCEALMHVIEDARCSSDANTRQAAWMLTAASNSAKAEGLKFALMKP